MSIKITKEKMSVWKTYQRKKYSDGIMSRREIAKLESLKGWSWTVEKTSQTKKDQILKIANAGGKKPRPHAENKDERTLGRALGRYINPKESIYDKEFKEQIRSVRPDWIRESKETRKERLLELAKDGKEKPSIAKEEEKPLYIDLRNYTVESNYSYDPDFASKLFKIRPDWSIGRK